MDWGHFKLMLSAQLQISEDALHVHAGLAILFAAALLLRRPPWSRWPVLIVAVIEAANETYDIYSLRVPPNDAGSWPASVHDFALTMLWPVMLMVGVPLFQRYTKRG